MRFFYAFWLSFNMLTIFPIFKIHTFFKGINGYSAMFYPLIGVILGTMLYMASKLGNAFFDPTYVSVIIFALWVLFSGAIHLDGFSDTIDGIFVDKNRSLEVMKDPHVGTMGMIFSVVFLMLKLFALMHIKDFSALVVVLMLSRLNATIAIYFFNYISSGVGMLIKEELKPWMVFIAVFLSFVVSALFNLFYLLPISLATLFIVGKFFQTRYGGLNGDMYGFIIEFSELMMLNALIVKL